MRNLTFIPPITLFILLTLACHQSHIQFDAMGVFEAEEIIISAEATGKIKSLNIQEGQWLNVGQAIGYIDSVQVYLKKKQLEAQIEAVLEKKPNIAVQLSVLKGQLIVAQKEQERIVNLVKGNAATLKQLDDINAQIEVLNSQIEAQKSTLNIMDKSINKEIVPLQIQIDQLNDQLQKCQIINPQSGTVINKYAQVHEMTTVGKALYKLADLSTIVLRAYITGDQLSSLKLNQQVHVFTDAGNGGYKKTKGFITWINDKAEFTPKTIQTKKERENRVYAIKVAVKNDGSYKIGMYGEIQF